MKTLDEIGKDVDMIQSIAIVPTMLDVICRATNMGFAAVARVTDSRWTACSVLDKIDFGLKPGGELVLESTICNEIRCSQQPVIIDHVATDKTYSDHHTPKMYGFQSYISVPIILPNGDFFGTLCAIDPNPAPVSDPKISDMFMLFAQLLAFYIQSLLVIDRTNQVNQQYRHMFFHSFREPVRKLSLYSEKLIEQCAPINNTRLHKTSGDILRLTTQLVSMLQEKETI